MSEDNDRRDVPEALAVPKKKARLSVVWIIPILAALVAVGIAVQSYLSKGPKITIVFKEAEGLEPGKTFIKYKDIEIGHVSDVKLSADNTKIEVTAEIKKSAAGLIARDTRFWVVKTQVSLSGISGLGTLLSGNYIGIDPGRSKERASHFTGLEVAPIVTGGVAGREFVLRADHLGSLGVGSPLYYRHLKAGQVIGYKLAETGKSFEVKVFVDAPYDRYVSRDTRFWEASGIDVSVGAQGVSVKTQSLVSVLVGGLAFEEPSGSADAEPAPQGTVFTLNPDRATAFAEIPREVQRYVTHFTGSVRGLSARAPVTFLGMPVGEVTDVGLEYHPESSSLSPRVELAIYPSRLLAHVSNAKAARPTTEQDRRAFVQRLVDRGLRAQLQTGSLVSGQLLVALEYFPRAPKAQIDWSREPAELPAVAGGLQTFEEKIYTILTKLEKMPLEDVGRDARTLLASLDQTTKSTNRLVTRVDGELVPDVRKALGSLDRTLTRVDGEVLPTLDRTLQGTNKLLVRAEGEVVPALTKTLEDLQRSTASIQRIIANTDATLLGPDAPAQQDLRDALQEFSRAARGIRLITDHLERNPSALIRGKGQEKP